jgi:hypothetical protein
LSLSLSLPQHIHRSPRTSHHIEAPQHTHADGRLTRSLKCRFLLLHERQTTGKRERDAATYPQRWEDGVNDNCLVEAFENPRQTLECIHSNRQHAFQAQTLYARQQAVLESSVLESAGDLRLYWRERERERERVRTRYGQTNIARRTIFFNTSS